MCPPDKIYAFLLPPETYQKFAPKTLRTKTILSRGVTGKTYCATFPFSNTGEKEKKKKTIKFHSDSDWIAIYDNPVKAHMLKNTVFVNYNINMDI